MKKSKKTYTKIRSRKNEVAEIKDQLQINLLEKQRVEKELSELLNAAHSILETHNFKETARKIFDACARTTGAKAGYVALLSDDGQENELLFLEDGGLPCSVNPELPMPIRGLRSECYKSGKVVYDNNFINSQWAAFMPAGHVALPNVMFAPLNIGGKTVGLMGLSNKENGFNENDARIAAAFGEYAAIALLNSRNIEELEKHTNELQELNATKDKLFSIISHDLKSPFNSILGYASLMHKQILGQNYDNLEEFSRLILQVSQNTYELLENLLNWSMLQKKSIKYFPEWFTVYETIRKISLIVQESLKMKIINLNISVDPWLKIYGDQQMLEIVIRNLVSNAIKFTPANGKIEILVTRSDSAVDFSVSDNGTGIKKEDIDKLFKTESGFSIQGTNNEKGTGLGLLLCKEFVEIHKGTIHVKSEFGAGSTFIVSIPVRQENENN